MQNNNHWISKKKILGRIAQLSTPNHLDVQRHPHIPRFCALPKPSSLDPFNFSRQLTLTCFYPFFLS